MPVSLLRPYGPLNPATPPEPAATYPRRAFIVTLTGGLLLWVAARGLDVKLSPLTWYLARASGVTLYLLLWLAAVTGLGLTTKALDRYGGRGQIYSLHVFAIELGLSFLTLHLLSLAADQTVKYGPAAVFVPFAASWREPWTGFGVIAGYLGVAVAGSFLLGRFVSYRLWRALHWLTLPLYALALAHGVGAGSDAGTPWAMVLYLVTASIVALLLATRLLRGPRRAELPVAPLSAPLDRLARQQHGERD